MNLFFNTQRPILDCLTRIYRKNGKWIQTTKKYRSKKMNNQEILEKHYESLGYKNLGYVNTSEKAFNACQKSATKQWHKVASNLHLVALHDIKAIVLVDSGD